MVRKGARSPELTHVHQEGVATLDVLLQRDVISSCADKEYVRVVWTAQLTAPSENAMPLSSVAVIHAQARCGQNCIPLGRASGVPIPD